MWACITPISEGRGQKDACRTAVDPSNRTPFGRRRQRKLFCFALPVNAPPLFVSFSSVDALIEALPADTREAYEAEIRSLAARGLPPAVSMRTLGAIFGVSTEFIGALSRAPHRYYRTFRIKKGRKIREIQAPRVALKVIQRWIGFYIARSAVLSPCVFGFIPGKGVIDAAKLHCQAEWVYSLDLRDFFPNITATQVRDSLLTLGYAERAAILITNLCTLGGQLPQGSPASPVLSNLVFMMTDTALEAVAESEGVRFSRYADDLVFSGKGVPPENLANRVRKVLVNNGWQIANEKEHLARLPARLKVHGLLVHGARPRLTKGYRNKIRAFRHLLAADKITLKDISKVKGHLAYADFVKKA